MVRAALCCALIIPLPAALQYGSVMRQPVGAAPYVALLCALPLAAIWRSAMGTGMTRRPSLAGAIAVGAVAAALFATTFITVRDYFWEWPREGHTRFVYHQEMTAASEYMKSLPEGAYVYFFSDRHPLGLETRQYLAPDVQGEDRSYEFSDFDGAVDGIDRSRPAVFVLLPDYADRIAAIEVAHPGGVTREHYRRGELDFIAYELPAEQ
jgi:hypothetical protein